MDALQRSNQRAFIFSRDYERLVFSESRKEVQGNLFGLFTTDGEPVIHAITDPICCLESKEYGCHLADIDSKDFPLSHIGNWRYSGSSGGIQRGLTCLHKTASPNFLDISVTAGVTLRASINAQEKKIECLPDESPFKNMKGEKEDYNSEEELEERKHLSDTKGIGSIPRRETSNSSDSEDVDTNVNHITERVQLQEGPLYLGIRGFQREFAVNRHDFKVFMFEEDHRMMTDLVLKYPHLETGGDLFGLWTTEGNAVLHIVLGPGQNCKRTGASFYQDIPYLKQNGELVTEDYMLCHIGEWHSHHQLHLFQPSGGDSSTVIRNYPSGVCGFLLIIANIVSPRQVEFSPYLYTKTSTYNFDQKGKIELLRAQNVFKQINRIKQSIDRGKETDNYSQGALYRYSEYSHKSHDSRGYPYQTSIAIESLPQAREPIKHTPQHRNPKQCLPQPSYSTKYPLQASGHRKYSPQTRRPIHTMARVSKTKSARNKLEDRPPWRY